jgi:Cu2+-containing amine oxidase
VWQNWHFRVDYSPREGLVLHRIGTSSKAQCGRSSTGWR